MCASLAGRDRLEMQVTSYGQIRPREKDKLDAATLNVTGLSASLLQTRKAYRLSNG